MMMKTAIQLAALVNQEFHCAYGGIMGLATLNTILVRIWSNLGQISFKWDFNVAAYLSEYENIFSYFLLVTSIVMYSNMYSSDLLPTMSKALWLDYIFVFFDLNQNMQNRF